MADATAQATVDEPAWSVGCEVAPIEMKLRVRVEPVLAAISGDQSVSKFFDELAAKEVETVDELRNDLTQSEINAIQRRTIRPATLRTLQKLIDPQGYKWRSDPSAPDRRRRGGNGNNLAKLTLTEQYALEGVEALDADTFRWGGDVFEGVPKKGQATTLNDSVERLFDNTWLAMGKVRRAPRPAHETWGVARECRAPRARTPRRGRAARRTS